MPAASDYCQLLQDELANVIKGQIPQQVRGFRSLGMLDALRSNINTGGIEPIQMKLGADKKKKVLLRYWQRADQSVSNGVLDPCATVPTKSPLEQEYEITNAKIEKQCTFDTADWKTYCESGNDIISLSIMSLFDPILQEVNRQATLTASTSILLDAGGTDTNVTPIPTPLFNGAGGLNPMGLYGFRKEWQNLLVNQTPIAVGDGALDAFAFMEKFGCCNADGQNLELIKDNGQFFYYQDTSVPITLAAPNNFIAWEPSKFQLATWNYYQGEHAREVSQHHFDGTVIDPISGVTFDIRVRDIDCGAREGSQITVTVGLYAQAFIMTPPDAYAVGDPLEGRVNILRFDAA
jgi:hypothetical protein